MRKWISAVGIALLFVTAGTAFALQSGHFYGTKTSGADCSIFVESGYSGNTITLQGLPAEWMNGVAFPVRTLVPATHVFDSLQQPLPASLEGVSSFKTSGLQIHVFTGFRGRPHKFQITTAATGPIFCTGLRP